MTTPFFRNISEHNILVGYSFDGSSCIIHCLGPNSALRVLHGRGRDSDSINGVVITSSYRTDGETVSTGAVPSSEGDAYCLMLFLAWWSNYLGSLVPELTA
jgi:hypothetical protein